MSMIAIIATLALIVATSVYFFMKPKAEESKKEVNKVQKQEEVDENQGGKEELSMKQLKKMARNTTSVRRTKPDHRFLDKNISEISGKKACMDLSSDKIVLAVSTLDRRHYIVNAKKIMGAKHKFKSISFRTDRIPSQCAISEHGKYLALSYSSEIEIYKVKKTTAELHSTTNVAIPSTTIGLLISEENSIVVSVGGMKEPNIHVFDLNGQQLHVENTKITNPTNAIFDKENMRVVLKSNMGSFRIYKIKTDNFGNYKGFEQEFLCAGYKGHMLDVTFTQDGKHCAAVSEGGNLTIWNTNVPSFAGASLPVLLNLSFDEEYELVEWCQEDDSSDSLGVLMLYSQRRMDFVRISGKKDNASYDVLESVEDPHVGNVMRQVDVRVNKKGEVEFFSRCDSRVYSWKISEF